MDKSTRITVRQVLIVKSNALRHRCLCYSYNIRLRTLQTRIIIKYLHVKGNNTLFGGNQAVQFDICKRNETNKCIYISKLRSDIYKSGIWTSNEVKFALLQKDTNLKVFSRKGQVFLQPETTILHYCFETNISSSSINHFAQICLPNHIFTKIFSLSYPTVFLKNVENNFNMLK